MSQKILIVDDERDVVEVVEKRLRQEGYVTSTAFDGEEALAKVQSEDPDIILLDLMLPKRNGYEVLKEVRQNHADRWRPVIIISARDELQSVKDCYTMEADHYLTKPCDIGDIVSGVHTMVSLLPLRAK